MKNVIVFASVALLSGCYGANIASMQVVAANEFCKNKGGVSEIDTGTTILFTPFNTRHVAFCNDGSRIHLDYVSLRKGKEQHQ